MYMELPVSSVIEGRGMRQVYWIQAQKDILLQISRTQCIIPIF